MKYSEIVINESVDLEKVEVLNIFGWIYIKNITSDEVLLAKNMDKVIFDKLTNLEESYFNIETPSIPKKIRTFYLLIVLLSFILIHLISKNELGKLVSLALIFIVLTIFIIVSLVNNIKINKFKKDILCTETKKIEILKEALIIKETI